MVTNLGLVGLVVVVTFKASSDAIENNQSTPSVVSPVLSRMYVRSFLFFTANTSVVMIRVVIIIEININTIMIVLLIYVLIEILLNSIMLRLKIPNT